MQLYVATAQNGLYRPAKELKGFARVSLQPGESRTVRFELNDRAALPSGETVAGRCRWAAMRSALARPWRIFVCTLHWPWTA
ncbi:MAG: fibronectin type III-like domain-contianing protein [Subdoligranulum sp.]